MHNLEFMKGELSIRQPAEVWRRKPWRTHRQRATSVHKNGAQQGSQHFVVRLQLQRSERDLLSAKSSLASWFVEIASHLARTASWSAHKCQILDIYGMLILKDEHAIDVLKSGNTGHLWHDFHAIGVHATDVGHPGDDVDNDHLCPAIVGLGQRRYGQGQWWWLWRW